MGLNIVFGRKDDWAEGIRAEMERAGHVFQMAHLDQVDIESFDAIVPLTLTDRLILQSRIDEGACVRAVLTSAAAERLCHDKLVFNQRLAEVGLGHLVPPLLHQPPEDEGAYPIILKRRQDAWGRHSQILAEPPGAEFRMDPDRDFLQAYVPGSDEFATHILMQDSRPVFVATVRYVMGGEGYVKGLRCPPLATQWESETPALAMLLEVLDAVEFRDGTCCIDYRLSGAHLQVFEVNPRFGSSLRYRLHTYMQAYLMALTQRHPVLA